MKKPVKTKADFVRRYSAGEFGNASKSWPSLDAMEQEGVLEFASKRSLYHVRNRIAGGPTWYNVPPEELADRWYKAVELNGGSNTLYVSEMAPHDRGVLQGEVRRTENYLELRYNTRKLPMRDGFAEEDLTSIGASAVVRLKEAMDGNSWDWLQYLLDYYPNHVVEFSTFGLPWGTLAPRFNTVFWEVRMDRSVGSNLSQFTNVY